MKKSFNILSLVFIYKVTSFNSEDRTCNLRVSLVGEDGDVRDQLFKGVGVSPLLSWKFQNQPDDYVIGKSYESRVNDPDWRVNPFQLIKYGEEGSEKMYLSCVNEAPYRTKVVQGVFDGDEYVTTSYRYHKKENYMRYRNRVKTNSNS